MIPHSRLSDEIFGVRQRVTACRKRVRLSRTRHKPDLARNLSDQIFPEPDSAAPQSGRYTDKHSSAERLVEEHEVGIT